MKRLNDGLSGLSEQTIENVNNKQTWTPPRNKTTTTRYLSVHYPVQHFSTTNTTTMSAVLGESTASNRQGKMPTTSPFKPTSKPTSRKSLSALSGDLSNADMTKDSAKLDDVTGSAKIRKRAYSVGGVAAGAGGKNLSPRSQARRTAVSHRADKVPRKTLTVCSLCRNQENPF